MKTSLYRRVLSITLLSVFAGVSAYALDWTKPKKKKEKQEAKCCNKAMEKECAKEMKQAAKNKAACEKKTTE
ncbi:hypothetical protein [Emticicia agri]|uniref:YtxH domain-containing protein n=1 Tax=Emticicia agri TaxID=2492393 RepID=A0A4Q5LT95_9BACT|nr:hypothetical protein [Emticicia agri]RYU92735.1 hypothetical protein EWM59_25700 [Emticicia agri]